MIGFRERAEGMIGFRELAEAHDWPQCHSIMGLGMAHPPHDDLYAEILLAAKDVERTLGLVGGDSLLCANGGPRDPRPLGRVAARFVWDLRLDQLGYTLVIDHGPGDSRRDYDFHIIAGQRKTT